MSYYWVHRAATAVLLVFITSLFEMRVMAHGPESQGTYVTTQEVDLKGGPGQNFETVRQFRKGTIFEIVGKEKGWLKVQLSEHSLHFGYLDERFATISEQHEEVRPTPAIPGAYIAAKPIIVRQGPGKEFAAAATLAKGTKIVVIGSDGEWLRIAAPRDAPPAYIERRTSLLEHAN